MFIYAFFSNIRYMRGVHTKIFIFHLRFQQPFFFDNPNIRSYLSLLVAISNFLDLFVPTTIIAIRNHVIFCIINDQIIN